MNAPTVRLAWAGTHSPRKVNALNTISEHGERPAILVSFFYLKPFMKNRQHYKFRDWVLDSGAYSANSIGAVISLDDYIAACKSLMATETDLVEIFALDVIGDHVGSLRNTEKMWKADVPAIPCFHFGEPWDLLKSLARDYPKVAIGGLVNKRISKKVKMRFLNEAFSLVWPKKLHGFGIGAEDIIMAFPFHSVDASNWELRPTKFGLWDAYGKNSLSIRGGKQNLRAEVEYHMRVERKARQRWAKEMSLLEGKESK